MQPHEVKDADVKFGFRGNIFELMPARPDIPVDYPGREGWERFQGEWFYNGLPADIEFYPRDGIDPEKALRHLEAIQSSFAPKHEHKREAVAWLASQWFEKVVAGGVTYP